MVSSAPVQGFGDNLLPYITRTGRWLPIRMAAKTQDRKWDTGRMDGA
tara:strand:+ start:624 stop:764 length:141 start_codon:yes stop_codon:yes gene_type:complete